MSTAALDKHPESKLRGITLDLGFSAFEIDVENKNDVEKVQITLVDCPGHASLMKTIICGANIIQNVILVIDCTKGFQPQTAECLALAEVFLSKNTLIVIALNKIDLLKQNNKKIEEQIEITRKVLLKTKFRSNFEIVTTSTLGEDKDISRLITALKKNISSRLEVYKQETSALRLNHAFLFSVDHCFTVKGKGVVLTGTVLTGTLNLGDIIELPALKESRKVKSLQSFHKSVDSVGAGDRAAILVSKLDSSLIERTLLCSPNLCQPCSGFITKVRKIRHFKGKVLSNTKYHISVGNQTVIGRVWFFGNNLKNENINLDTEYEYDDELLQGGKLVGGPITQGVIIKLERNILLPAVSQNKEEEKSSQLHLIGSRLDLESNDTSKSCRLAFSGKSPTSNSFVFKDTEEDNKLKLYILKQRSGLIERKVNDSEVIVNGLISKEDKSTNLEGKQIYFDNKTLVGSVVGRFGKSGKVKVRLKLQTKDKVENKKVYLFYKKYIKL